MHGSETKLTQLMEGADKRFIVPVYQRKYEWTSENCRQLYSDLKKVIAEDRPSHFFGSIVASGATVGKNTEYHIIDGQQRLTTVSLLLLAICNLISENKVECKDRRLNEQIRDRFLVSPWAPEDQRIKLIPIEDDRDALAKLFGDKHEYDMSSALTRNYLLFYEEILSNSDSVDDLFDAINKLEIIIITLEPRDNAQLIFESLNSTGLSLTEGDKIRNYILMKLPHDKQSFYFKNYWVKIEKCTASDENSVSGFIRDYLSIKTQITPAINRVYREFKSYTEVDNKPLDKLLEDMLCYARHFEKLKTCKSGLRKELDDCLFRLSRLDVVVTRPFFMEVLQLNQNGEISPDDILQVFLITETYLFRRNICEVPTNALNRIFVNLNREIFRYDKSYNQYLGKFVYSLFSKKESGRFPDDAEFSNALNLKQVYQMRGKFKAYMFERFENYGTIEAKDVYANLDGGVYTIEHIMPQHLSPEWMEALGSNAKQIHETWLHRLANLTLTGYNPSLSNKPFIEKRDSENGGYKASGLRMNQKIATKNAWGEAELIERNSEMVEYALKIWFLPQNTFVPVGKKYNSITLDDEVELTGRQIAKYVIQGKEIIVSSWADMIEHLVTYLHSRDKTILYGLVSTPARKTDLSFYLSDKENGVRTPLKIDENLYLEKNTSTHDKRKFLRLLFPHFNIAFDELTIYLRDDNEDENTDELEIRRKNIFDFLLEWCTEQPDVLLDSKKSSISHTRFTTRAMSALVPDIPGVMSGWKTENHYFYELINGITSGENTLYLHFVLSSENATPEFLKLCENINRFYPSRKLNEDWKWRVHFKTKTVVIPPGEISKDSLFSALNGFLENLRLFEKDLKQKLDSLTDGDLFGGSL